MAIDANVTNDVPTPQSSDDQTAEVASSPQPQQRGWSMPKPPVTRGQADAVGRIARRGAKSVITLIADIARYGGRLARRLARAIETVPPALRVLGLVGVLTLFGMVGAITLHDSLGLACIVVVVPVCSITLGALGHRWYAQQRAEAVQSPAAKASAADLQRSVEYVDHKLTVALNAFGAERHQHAMIALFQAKTAVELTLGTEQDTANHIDALLAVDDHNARPRIRAGATAKSLLRENTSLAAS